MPAQDSDIPQGSRQTYHLPRWGLVEFAVCLLLGIRRSFAADSRWTMRVNPPLPRVIDLDCVPAEGPFILVANHYERPGLNMHFAGMAVAAALAERRPPSPQIHWIITSEWHGRHIGPFPVPVWLTRLIFRRVAHLYGFVVMPQAESETTARAAALKQAIAIVRGEGERRRGEPVGLMPEARGKGTLIEARPGSGLFIQMLSRRGVPLLPVGLYEDKGRLTIRFGEPFSLTLERQADRQEQDRLAREQVMVAIGRLLPQRMWGFYAPAIEKSIS